MQIDICLFGTHAEKAYPMTWDGVVTLSLRNQLDFTTRFALVTDGTREYAVYFDPGVGWCQLTMFDVIESLTPDLDSARLEEALR